MAPHQNVAAGLDVLAPLAFSCSLPIRDVAPSTIPSQPGVYALWEGSGRLLYAGLAGVRWTAEAPRPASTLARRLADHFDARRADVLTSYLFERIVAPTLTRQDLVAMGDGELSIRDLVRSYLRSSARVAWSVTPDYLTARVAEQSVREGALGTVPLINPA